MKYKASEYRYIDFDDKDGFIAVNYHIIDGSINIIIPKDPDFKEILHGVSLSKKETKVLYEFLKQYYSKGDQ